MATFYQGYRPVLRGRNTNNWVNTNKGNKVGVYSNYQIQDTGGQILTGAPDKQYVVGTGGTYTRPRLLEYLWAGGHHIAPMDNPGNGYDTAYLRGDGHIWNGLQGAKAFPDGYGHAPFRTVDYALHSNYEFKGLENAQPLKNPGHAKRYGLSYTAGFDPWVYNGVSVQPMANPGQAAPADHTSLYGRNRVNEWRGSPASKAL